MSYSYIDKCMQTMAFSSLTLKMIMTAPNTSQEGHAYERYLSVQTHKQCTYTLSLSLSLSLCMSHAHTYTYNTHVGHKN